MSTKIPIGKITGPHALQGQVKIHSYCEEPLAIADYQPLFDADGNEYVISKASMAGRAVLARLKGVDNRNQSEALKGVELFINDDQLPEELEENEFYHAELIGLPVVNQQAIPIGDVIAVHNFGAGDLLEIRPAQQGQQDFFVPFNDDIDITAENVRLLNDQWLEKQ